MPLKLFKTSDGSFTLFVPELNEHYHSTFGAVNESRHIFINAGFNYFKNLTEQIFQKVYNSMRNNGVLVTYSAKGMVKRNMISAGLKVEKIPGPKGKREFIRAVKK